MGVLASTVLIQSDAKRKPPCADGASVRKTLPPEMYVGATRSSS